MFILHLAFQEANKPGMRETLIEVGFVYYFILARFYDIDPLMQEKEGILSFVEIILNGYFFNILLQIFKRFTLINRFGD